MAQYISDESREPFELAVAMAVDYLEPSDYPEPHVIQETGQALQDFLGAHQLDGAVGTEWNHWLDDVEFIRSGTGAVFAEAYRRNAVAAKGQDAVEAAIAKAEVIVAAHDDLLDLIGEDLPSSERRRHADGLVPCHGWIYELARQRLQERPAVPVPSGAERDR